MGFKSEIDIVKKRVFIFWCGLKDSTFRRGKVDTGPQLEYLSFECCGMGGDHFITCTSVFCRVLNFRTMEAVFLTFKELLNLMKKYAKNSLARRYISGNLCFPIQLHENVWHFCFNFVFIPWMKDQSLSQT